MNFSILITTYLMPGTVATSVATFETRAQAEAAIAAPHGVLGCPECNVTVQRLYPRNKLTLVRGLPGSGKSTWVTYQGDLGSHFEADMFFQGEEGYQFDPSKLPQAHAWCQKACLDALMDRGDVIISNTFTQHWEMAPYLNMAEALGVEVCVVKMATSYDNVHGVPEVAIEAMKARWEDYPGEVVIG